MKPSNIWKWILFRSKFWATFQRFSWKKSFKKGLEIGLIFKQYQAKILRPSKIWKWILFRSKFWAVSQRFSYKKLQERPRNRIDFRNVQKLSCKNFETFQNLNRFLSKLHLKNTVLWGFVRFVLTWKETYLFLKNLPWRLEIQKSQSKFFVFFLRARKAKRFVRRNKSSPTPRAAFISVWRKWNSHFRLKVESYTFVPFSKDVISL